MIIIDSREQKQVWSPYSPGVIKVKLDEGDYTTTKLYNKAHIERKTAIDLYGSIIQGHDRFVREILRAREKGVELSVFVECTYDMFVNKMFYRGRTLQTPSEVLVKILDTMEKKYGLEFVWCDDRDDFRERALNWFKDREEKL